MRRRLMWVLGTFIVVVVATFAGTLLQTPTYRATGMLEIGTQDRGVQSMEALFAARDPSEFHLRTQYGILRSNELARRVIRDLDLLDTEEFGGPPLDSTALRQARVLATSDTSAAHPLMQRAVARFKKQLVIDPSEESRLVAVHFESQDRVRAARVVNEILSAFVRMGVDEGKRAAEWLDREMESARERLRNAEENLYAYTDSTGLPYRLAAETEPTDAVDARLRDLQEQLSQARNVRYEKESLHDLVSRRGLYDAVGDRVVEDLSTKLSDLTVEYERLSTIFTDQYPQVTQVRRQIEQLEALLGQERQRIVERIRRDYEVALHQEQLLEAELAESQADASALSLRSAQYHLLRQEVLAAQSLHATLQEKRQEAEVSAAVEATGITLVDRAVPPIVPYRPVLAYNLGLAALLGLMIGVVVALLRERTDDTVLTGEDVDATTQLPILGLIPSYESLGNGSSHPLGSPHMRRLLGQRPEVGQRPRWPRIDDGKGGRRQSGALADAFGALRSAVLFEANGQTPRSLLVSSCRAGEGKTTVSVNLALSLARLGHRVLLVDADLRRPSVHRALGLRDHPGLVQCLEVGGNWWAAVQTTRTAGLEVLVSGGPVEDAGDLLSDPRLSGLLRAAEREYNYVLFDAPALFINAPDARVLAHLVDGVIVVVRSEVTPRALANRIPEVVPNVIGLIVNDLDPSRLPEYYRDYFAEYGDRPESTNGDAAPDGAADRTPANDRAPESPAPEAE